MCTAATDTNGGATEIGTDSVDFMTGPFLLSLLVFVFIHYSFCFLVTCGRLTWLPVSFLAHIHVAYLIVTHNDHVMTANIELPRTLLQPRISNLLGEDKVINDGFSENAAYILAQVHTAWHHTILRFLPF